MNNFTQISPVSDLPKKYSKLLKKANDSNEPIIFFRRNRPVAAVISFRLLQEYEDAKRKEELKEVFTTIKEGEEDYRKKKTKILKKPADIWKPWKKA